ncbi:MAG TPA: NHLP bacteriocin system secretion protein [Chthoniobacterales bacterium]|nr:NHLP bacteriocin system secretion protein [Chthoniobacterales bacterium]
MSQPLSKQNLFREAALAKIRSPEQLDALLPITSPLGWLALLTSALALGVLLFWAFFGTIMRTATGQGIIMRNSEFGIMAVAGQATGLISEVKVEEGDKVEAGRVMFHLDLPSLKAQLASSENSLENLLAQDTAQTKDESDRIRTLQETLANQQSLYEQGLLTKSQILQTKSAIYDVQAHQYSRSQQILDQRARIKDLEIRLAQDGSVRAAHSGEVIEIDVNVGDFVQPGRVLARMESLSGQPGALIFVPANDGKKIKVDMAIRISPSTVKPEEYGYIQGKVTSVSAFPATRDEMMSYLQNDVLVNRLLNGGEVIPVTATLEPDPKTPSGYRWSSSRGPDVSVEGGTVCTASVVLVRQRPITLLIPFLKKQLGLY